MVDMSAFIAAKSDQLNADDLMDAPRTITITKVTAAPDAAEQPVGVHYEGDAGKPWRPCKTCRRILVGIWGKDASKYAGRSLRLYRDPEVKFGGLQVGGIRISHMSHIDGEKTLALMVKQGRKAPFKILPLEKAAQPSAQHDFSAELEQLKVSAKPGATDALKAVWEAIGKDARKALAAELPALQAACAEAPADDVAFDAIDPAQAKLDEIKSALAAAGDAAAVEKVIADAQPHYDAFSDPLKMALDIAMDQARKRFETAEAE